MRTRSVGALSQNQWIALLGMVGWILVIACADRTIIRDCPPLEDPHLLFVSPDEDGDHISDVYETCSILLTSDNADVDRNGRRDGMDFSPALSQWVAELPDETEASIGAPFRRNHDFFGTEYCRVCGEEFQRGVTTITNPVSEQEISIPYIAIHFLDRGSLVYAGSSHHGQVDACALLATLRDCHQIGIGNDRDGDGLADEEETALGRNPDDPDEDGTWREDGPEIARRAAETIQNLPIDSSGDSVYRSARDIGSPQWSQCPVCPHWHLVGTGWDIVDPVSGRSVYLDNLSFHFLEHGSFGGEAVGFRVDVVALLEVLGT